MMARSVDERREGRSQDQRTRRMFDGKSDRNRGAERLAEVHEPPYVDVLARFHVLAGGSCIAREPFFGRRARVAAVAAVVEQEHGKAVASQARRQVGTKRTVTGIAVEDDDRLGGSN